MKNNNAKNRIKFNCLSTAEAIKSFYKEGKPSECMCLLLNGKEIR